jgi:hypothetical protein
MHFRDFAMIASSRLSPAHAPLATNSYRARKAHDTLGLAFRHAAELPLPLFSAADLQSVTVPAAQLQIHVRFRLLAAAHAVHALTWSVSFTGMLSLAPGNKCCFSDSPAPGGAQSLFRDTAASREADAVIILSQGTRGAA